MLLNIDEMLLNINAISQQVVFMVELSAAEYSCSESEPSTIGVYHLLTVSMVLIGELPKLCEKISILMQANVLIADWYVAPLFPHI